MAADAFDRMVVAVTERAGRGWSTPPAALTQCPGVPMAIKPWLPISLCRECQQWSGHVGPTRGPALPGKGGWSCAQFAPKQQAEQRPAGQGA